MGAIYFFTLYDATHTEIASLETKKTSLQKTLKANQELVAKKEFVANQLARTVGRITSYNVCYTKLLRIGQTARLTGSLPLRLIGPAKYFCRFAASARRSTCFVLGFSGSIKEFQR